MEKLIESLNVPIKKEIDEIWAGEAENRVKSIQSGKVPLVDGEKVIDQMRKRMKK